MFRATNSIIDVDEGFLKNPSLSTAGAVTVRDSKGRLVTRKVKVHRYIAGKRPKYASSSDSDEDDKNDSDDDTEILEARRELIREQRLKDDVEEVLVRDEDANELLNGVVAEEQFYIGQEDSLDEGSSSDEDFEEDFECLPRLKPVFIPRVDRVTIKETNEDEEYLEIEKKMEERKVEAMKIVEEAIKMDMDKKVDDDTDRLICDLVTDDENDEVEYEKWKLRELKRIKRDREEREAEEKERLDIERNRRLAEQGRLKEVSSIPRVVVNEQPKGKYKYLQKYYHRGAFYLDKDEEVLKRDFAEPTLEDHFDKTVLPKVMQVKNFGMASRTKYTHLVDQDTTAFDSAWATEKSMVSKWHTARGGGMKQIFDRPSLGGRPKNRDKNID
ncbi:hypothetical protein ACOME3_000626 [Neoechinorhynchus agilis]